MEVLKQEDRVLIIQTAFIGDCLLTLPLLAFLDKVNPGIKTDIVTTGKSAGIFEAYDKVNKVIVFDKRGKHKSLRGILEFAKELREGGYTRVIAPHRSARTSILVMLSGIKESFGFENSALKFIYRRLVPYRADRHELYRNLAFAGEDVHSDTVEGFTYKIQISPEEELHIENAVEAAGRKKIIAVAPGTEWTTKQYPPEHFAEIVKHYSEEGFAVAMIGTSREKELSQRMLEKAGTLGLNLCGWFSIPGTINFLKQCEVLVSNDSSPVHMGLIAGTKTVSIYCSTVPEFGFYPAGKNSGWVSLDNLACKPCGIHGYKECPLDHFNCGYGLKPGTVIGKIDEVLSNG